MATQAEIRTKALQKLKVFSPGVPIPVSDSTIVDEAYDNLYSSLLEEEAVWWGSGDDVPTEAVLPIVSILTAEIADDFLGNGQEHRYQRLQLEAYGPDQGERVSAISRLRKMAKTSYVPAQTVSVDY